MLGLKSNDRKFNIYFYFSFYWGFFSAGYFAYKKIDIDLPYRRWIPNYQAL